MEHIPSLYQSFFIQHGGNKIERVKRGQKLLISLEEIEDGGARISVISQEGDGFSFLFRNGICLFLCLEGIKGRLIKTPLDSLEDRKAALKELYKLLIP